MPKWKCEVRKGGVNYSAAPAEATGGCPPRQELGMLEERRGDCPHRRSWGMLEERRVTMATGYISFGIWAANTLILSGTQDIQVDVDVQKAVSKGLRRGVEMEKQMCTPSSCGSGNDPAPLYHIASGSPHYKAVPTHSVTADLTMCYCWLSTKS